MLRASDLVLSNSPFRSTHRKFFDSVEDTFELQRGLNNCFAYDLVPGTPIIESALKAARRLNDFPTAVRVFEGIKEKVENKAQYKAYLDEFASLRKELGECSSVHCCLLPSNCTPATDCLPASSVVTRCAPF